MGSFCKSVEEVGTADGCGWMRAIFVARVQRAKVLIVPGVGEGWSNNRIKKGPRGGPEGGPAASGGGVADLGSFGGDATEDVKHEDMKHEEALQAVGSFGKSAGALRDTAPQARRHAGTQARRHGGDEAVLGGFVSQVFDVAENNVFSGGASADGSGGCAS